MFIFTEAMLSKKCQKYGKIFLLNDSFSKLLFCPNDNDFVINVPIPVILYH